MQVADARNQRRREGQPLVPPDGLVAMLLQGVEQHERLVERQRADRVLQQQAQPVGRQRPELAGSPAVRLEQRRHPEVVDPFLAEPFQNLVGNIPGVERSASGSTLQSTLVRLAKPAIGLRSMPTLGMPSFLHSTSVVPVPQKGSRTRCVESTPKVSR